MRKLLTSVLLFIALTTFGQQKAFVSIGAGVARIRGLYGPAMQFGYYAPINAYLYYGLSGGYATGHEEMVSKTKAGSYLHHSEMFGNINAMAVKNFSPRFLVYADIGAGIRYSYHTHILVNSIGDITMSGNKHTGAGLVLGAGFYGFVRKNLAIGLKYSLDFYMEVPESIWLKCIFQLK